MKDVSKSFMEPVVGKKAACATVDPELFFPNFSSQDRGEFTERRAKAVCARCPLTSACLEFALHTGDKHAILGGMNPAERESIRRGWRGPARPNPFIPLEEAA